MQEARRSPAFVQLHLHGRQFLLFSCLPRSQVLEECCSTGTASCVCPLLGNGPCFYSRTSQSPLEYAPTLLFSAAPVLVGACRCPDSAGPAAG